VYNIVFTERALKDLERLSKEVKERIASKLKEYSIEPFKYARKLNNQKIGEYRFRMGDYRIIFDHDDNKIIILRIGHRKDIYD